MRTNPNANKNRHINKPYERTGTSSSNGENSNTKGLLGQMKESVSELFSQSWMPGFFRYNAITNINQMSSGNIERESANDSPSNSNLEINQIYPEEGTSAGPSTSNINKPLMTFKLNNIEKYKSSNILLRAEPLLSSTPSSSQNFMDKSVGGIDTPINQSSDVSIVTPNNFQLDMSEPSTSQTPVQSIPNTGSITKKRLRESFNDSELNICNSAFQNKSLPQISALSSKRPRFNASTYGTSVNASSALAESSFSIFYPGKTMYGGAANYRKSKCLTSLKSLQRSQVQAKPAPEQSEEEAGLSVAAKRILNCLQKMSTPLSEAKKMPIEKARFDYFDSPYVSDFHKHRPALRTDSPRTPPVNNLITPSQTTTKDNLATFLKKQGTSTSSNESLVEKVTNCPFELPQRDSEKMIFNNKSTTESIFSFPSVKPLQELDKVSIERMKMHSVKSVPDSFKIISKKGVPQFDDSPVVVPDLPNISLPLTSLPTISFGSNFKPVLPVFEAKNKEILPPITKEFNNFKGSNIGLFNFSSPEVLRDSSDKAIDADVSTEFVFSKPQPEKDISNSIPKIKRNEKLQSLKLFSTEESNKSSSAFTNGLPSFNWGDKFKPANDSWECDTCCIRNNASDSKCVACQTSNLKGIKSSSVQTIKPAFIMDPPIARAPEDTLHTTASLPQETQITHHINGFGSMFNKKEGQWTCSVCMIDNNKGIHNCVACMTPKSGSNSNNSGLDQKSAFSGFGSQFSLPKSDWECDVCLVRNKESSKKCVACGSLHPSIKNIDPNSEQVATGFTFGVSSQSIENSNKFNSITAFGSGKLTEAATDKFSFGSNTTTTKSSCNTFKFGVTALPDKSISSKPNFGSDTPSAKSNETFNFGTNTTTSKSGFDLGMNTATSKSGFNLGMNTTTSKSGFNLGMNTATSKSVFSLGMNTATTQSGVTLGTSTATSKSDSIPNLEANTATTKSDAKLNFGGNTSTAITKSPGTFNFGSSTSTSTNTINLGSTSSLVKSNSTINFGSNASSVKSSSSELKLLNTTAAEPSKTVFNFGSNAKSTKSSGSDIFGSNSNDMQSNKTSFQFGTNEKFTESPNTEFKVGTTKPSTENPIKGECNKHAFLATTQEMRGLGYNITQTSNTPSGNFSLSSETLKTTEAPSSIFSFGSSSTTTHPNKSDKFTFGSSTLPLKSNSISSTFTFEGKNNSATKSDSGTLPFRSNTAPTNSISSALNFGGANTALDKSNTGPLAFGGNTLPTTKTNSSTFNFGSNTLPVKANGGAFNFGSNTLITKPQNETYNFGSNPKTTQSSKSDFNFGGNTKSDSVTNAFTFGAKRSNETPVNSEPETGFLSATKEIKPSTGFNFGQPPNEQSGNFGFGSESFTPSKSVFSIGQANGDSAPSMSVFGSGSTNPFNSTGSGIGPSKSPARIIKKAVRRTRK